MNDRIVEVDVGGMKWFRPAFWGNAYTSSLQYRQIIADDEYQVERYLPRDGGTVIDAGTSLGFFSYLAASWGCSVFSFEPDPDLFCSVMASMAYNLGSDPWPVLIQGALGDRHGWIEYHRWTVSEGQGWTGPVRSGTASDGNSWVSDQEMMVPCYCIDDFLAADPRFIKIDVEGFEREVLSGATMTLNHRSPVLAFATTHYTGDHEALPEFVRRICPDYRVVFERTKEETFDSMVVMAKG